MPRRVRTGSAGVVFHVLNRGVRRARLFDGEGDYCAFLDIIAIALARHPIEIFAYCVMPNHFHLVASPRHDGQLSAFMQWMTGTHSKRWHQWRGTNGTGCVYQGRFKAFPVQHDGHFLRVCRYVERNALRARLAPGAEAWPWGSAHQRTYDCPWFRLADWPVTRPDDWLAILNAEDPDTEVIRKCVVRSRPFGSQEWVDSMAKRLAMTKSLRPIGRPRENGVGIRFT